ncbi:phosphotransferase family protein [Haloferax sp. DFSO52]|uniref:phosphotransferase family protein n=1 Tax=Haloferax sp. DFSO52 TaxID=3388505 RepID=UPI003A849022
MTDVAAVLTREFSHRGVTSVTPVQQGNHKHTAIVAFSDGGTVVVQLSTDTASLHLETALARAVASRTSIPVPSVLSTGTVADCGYAVVEHIRGRELHEEFVELELGAQRDIAASFGRGLAELHDAFALDGYGAVTADPNGSGFEFQSGEATDWNQWFSAYYSDGVDALPPVFDPLRDELTAALDRTELSANPPSCLYPWDLRPGNALVDDEGIAAVLDWGGPLAAAPGLAVAKTEHLVADWYVSGGTSLRRSFRDGYESVRPYPSVEPLYRVAAVLRSAVDSNGEVTRPGYPERTGSRAVSFHQQRLETTLANLSFN